MTRPKFYEFIDQVETGQLLSCELVKQSVARFKNDLTREEIYFDEVSAANACAWIETLVRDKKYIEDGDKLIEEDVCLTLSPFQAFIVANIFGWKWRENGRRRFKYSYLEMAKGSGKTTLLAAMSLLALALCKRDGEVYSCATVKDQARIAFRFAASMANSTEHLDGFVKVLMHSITVPETNSFFQVMSSEDGVFEGKTPDWVNVDEYHIHKTDYLYNSIKSAMVKKFNNHMSVITTAGFDRGLPCYQLRENCCKILNGTLQDDSTFALIFTLDKEDDWHDQNLWIKSNPNLGITVQLRDLQTNYNLALTNGASEETNFKTKNLNIWTDAAEVWITEKVWNKNTHGIDENELLGLPCYGGLDLASGIDFNAFVLLFPNVRPDVHAAKLWLWKPANKIKENKEKKDYRDWVKKGLIDTTPGDTVEFGFITEKIKELAGQYDLQSISYDPYRSVHGVVQDLTNYGLQMHILAQTMRFLSYPTSKLEELVTKCQLEHFNNPVLSWMISQAEIIKDSKGNIMMTKKNQNKKVDGVSALINAIAEWETFKNDDEQGFIMVKFNKENP